MGFYVDKYSFLNNYDRSDDSEPHAAYISKNRFYSGIFTLMVRFWIVVLKVLQLLV